MKNLSLQWRITIMTAFLIGITCVLMNCFIGYSGKRYMDSIGSKISACGDTQGSEPDSFNPESEDADRDLTIIVNGAQESFNSVQRCACVFCQRSGTEAASFFRFANRKSSAE